MAEEKAPTEVPLTGGNSTEVHRVGRTVRRVTGPQSSSVHFLLDHLKHAGYRYAPQFLGIDERGREVLTYREGTVGSYPIPSSARSSEAMETALLILKGLHDLTVGLVPPAGHATHLAPGLIPEVICHWDAAPYNYVFDGPRAVALIDFDEAGPGRRIDDLAYFAYRFAPLCSDDNFSDGGWPPGTDRLARLARIFELYPDYRANQLPDLIIARLDAMKDSIASRDAWLPTRTPSAPLGPHRDHLGIYSRDQAFISKQRSKIVSAVS